MRYAVLLVLLACNDDTVLSPVPVPTSSVAASSSTTGGGSDAGCRVDWVCCRTGVQQAPICDELGPHCLEGWVTGQPGECEAF